MPWLKYNDKIIEQVSGILFKTPKDDYAPKFDCMISTIPPDSEIIDSFIDESVWISYPVLHIIKIDFTCDIKDIDSIRAIMTPNDDFSDTEILGIWHSFNVEHIHTELKIINLAFDLCQPGSSIRGPYSIIHEGKTANGRFDHCYLEGAYQQGAQVGLTRGAPLDFSSTWRKLSRTNGLREGVPSTPFGKALSALTYVTLNESIDARFFRTVWCCYGLEGFFASGHQSRGIQVSERVALFLGVDFSIASKHLKLLYDERSKFIHGNKALSSALIEIHPPEGKSSIDEWDAEHIGAYFLAETTRECIRRDIDSQSFRLVMDER